MGTKTPINDLNAVSYGDFRHMMDGFIRDAHNLRGADVSELTPMQLLTRNLWEDAELEHNHEFDLVRAQVNDNLDAVKELYQEYFDVPTYEPFNTLFPPEQNRAEA